MQKIPLVKSLFNIIGMRTLYVRMFLFKKI